MFPSSLIMTTALLSPLSPLSPKKLRDPEDRRSAQFTRRMPAERSCDVEDFTRRSSM